MIEGGIMCGDDFQSHMGRDDLNGGVETYFSSSGFGWGQFWITRI